MISFVGVWLQDIFKVMLSTIKVSHSRHLVTFLFNTICGGTTSLSLHVRLWLLPNVPLMFLTQTSKFNPGALFWFPTIVSF